MGIRDSHEVVDLADGLGAAVPRLVGGVDVGGYGEYFHTQLLKLFILVGNVAQLGRAYESEVRRVEEKDSPLTFYVGFRNINELAALEGGGVERFNFAVNHIHSRYLPLVEFRHWLT